MTTRVVYAQPQALLRTTSNFFGDQRRTLPRKYSRNNQFHGEDKFRERRRFYQREEHFGSQGTAIPVPKENLFFHSLG
jgi:hypothetical protein